MHPKITTHFLFKFKNSQQINTQKINDFLILKIYIRVEYITYIF